MVGLRQGMRHHKARWTQSSARIRIVELNQCFSFINCPTSVHILSLALLWLAPVGDDCKTIDDVVTTSEALDIMADREDPEVGDVCEVGGTYEAFDKVWAYIEALDEVSTTGEALDSARIVILNQCFIVTVPPPLLLSTCPSAPRYTKFSNWSWHRIVTRAHNLSLTLLWLAPVWSTISYFSPAFDLMSIPCSCSYISGSNVKRFTYPCTFFRGFYRNRDPVSAPL